MNNYVKHAQKEFRAAGWIDENGVFEDGMQKMMCEQVCELLDLFSEHGHSGLSAPYAIDLFKKLAAFEPIVPLTGEDWEWNEIGEDRYQNSRCSHVFKENGQAYDIEGRIFREPDGCCYTSKDSRVNITFPYTPKTEYIQIKENNNMDTYRKHIELLGYKAKDKVTGFKGVIDSVCFDAYGCIQISLKPPMDKDGNCPIGYWFDVTRLDIDTKKRIVNMPNFYEGYVAEGKKGAAAKPELRA